MYTLSGFLLWWKCSLHPSITVRHSNIQQGLQSCSQEVQTTHRPVGELILLPRRRTHWGPQSLCQQHDHYTSGTGEIMGQKPKSCHNGWYAFHSLRQPSLVIVQPCLIHHQAEASWSPECPPAAFLSFSMLALEMCALTWCFFHSVELRVLQIMESRKHLIFFYYHNALYL